MILFLHGWPEDRTIFDGVMARLSADHDVMAIDLPGIGGSTEIVRSSDKRTLARLVKRVIAERGLRDVTLVGHAARERAARSPGSGHPELWPLLPG